MAKKRRTTSWETQELFYHDVRLLQKRTRCSNYVCQEFVHAFKKYAQPKSVKRKTTLKLFDKKSIKAAGVKYIVLHGCPKCNRHVYLQEDKDTNCPICGYSRYDEIGQPYEVFPPSPYYLPHTHTSQPHTHTPRPPPPPPPPHTHTYMYVYVCAEGFLLFFNEAVATTSQNPGLPRPFRVRVLSATLEGR